MMNTTEGQESMAWTHRFIPLVMTLVLGGLSLVPPGEAQKKKEPDQETRIRVNVEMVSLPVVVTTREGKRVTDLVQEDFEIFEDGVPQEIAGFSPTDEPISVALLLDTSGSTEQKLARIQNEAIRFVKLLHPDDSVAVLSFANDVSLHEDFSIDRDRNARGVKETRPGGSTVLYEAVWLSLEEVLKPVQERKALVLFSDGVDTASRKVSMKETLEQARETRATIYGVYYDTSRDVRRGVFQGPGPTVGGYPVPGGPTVVNPPIYGSGRYHEAAAGRDYMAKLAENSGGTVLDALAIDDIGPAFDQIARELASQYSIGYYSKNTKADGKFRKVEVKLKKPGLVARTKKGYNARKPAK
jgi:Ca-activated chloride channel homolog